MDRFIKKYLSFFGFLQSVVFYKNSKNIFASYRERMENIHEIVANNSAESIRMRRNVEESPRNKKKSHRGRNKCMVKLYPFSSTNFEILFLQEFN